MKTNFALLAAIACVFHISAAQAEDSTASSGLGSAVSESSSSGSNIIGLKKFEEDQQITDAELKSRAGSLSVLSVKANLGYYGPPISDLSAPDQPNPDHTVAPTAEGPSGSIGARYRFSPTSSVTVNAGVTDQYLFTSKPATWDMNNPFITYDKSFKIGAVQMVASPGFTLITSDVYRVKGETSGFTGSLYSAYNIPNSKFTLSNSFGLGYYFFDRDYFPDGLSAKGKPIANDGKVRRTSITEAPIVKYNVNDKFNVNTSWGFSLFNPRYYTDQLRLNSRVVNEWVGVGYAVTRDIYINPYVQFYPTQFSWKTATMNLSTVFSLM